MESARVSKKFWLELICSISWTAPVYMSWPCYPVLFFTLAGTVARHGMHFS